MAVFIVYQGLCRLFLSADTDSPAATAVWAGLLLTPYTDDQRNAMGLMC